MSPEIRSDVDWVTEREKCSTYELFQQLRSRVQADVAKLNELRHKNNRVKEEFLFESRDDVFGVLHPRTTRVVRFELAEAIEVTGQPSKVAFEARAVYTPEGQCFLQVGAEKLFIWQIARRALEGLLFEM
jgi:hypothetical protein